MGGGLCVAAEVIHTSWEADLPKWCQQVVWLAACAQAWKVKWACYRTSISFLKDFLEGQNFSITGKKITFLLSAFGHVLLDTEHLEVKSEGAV